MPAYLLPDDLSSIIVNFDLTLSEGHETTAQITEHPVEDGVVIADHIREDPDVLTLEVFVTNTPLNDLGGRGAVFTKALSLPVYEPPLRPLPGSLIRAIKGEILSAIRPALNVSVLQFDEPFDRVREIYETLLQIKKGRVLSSAVTSIRTYESMALIGVSVPRTVETGGAASITLSLKQIRTVTTATVAAPKPAEPRGAGAQNKGGQSTKKVGDKEGAKSKSMAVKALAAIGVISE
jgi:hypothetical protein